MPGERPKSTSGDGSGGYGNCGETAVGAARVGTGPCCWPTGEPNGDSSPIGLGCPGRDGTLRLGPDEECSDGRSSIAPKALKPWEGVATLMRGGYGVARAAGFGGGGMGALGGRVGGRAPAGGMLAGRALGGPALGGRAGGRLPGRAAGPGPAPGGGCHASKGVGKSLGWGKSCVPGGLGGIGEGAGGRPVPGLGWVRFKTGELGRSGLVWVFGAPGIRAVPGGA